MSTGKWVLWSRHRGTDQDPIVRKRGTLATCRIEGRFLTEASERNHGAMPYPALDMIVLPVGESPTAAFREITPL